MREDWLKSEKLPQPTTSTEATGHPFLAIQRVKTRNATLICAREEYGADLIRRHV
jgi:hypothetical protein